MLRRPMRAAHSRTRSMELLWRRDHRRLDNNAAARLRAAHSAFRVSVGAAIADIENFNMLNPSRGPKLDDIALTRLHQCSRYRRYPTHLATIEIGLVDANDGDRSLRSPLMSVGDGRAKEHLIQVFLLRRVDQLGNLQPLGKKAYSPIDLA